MSKPIHFTIVYTVNDEDSFKEERQKIMDNMKSSNGEPWAITAMSLDHELQRLHLIEEALNERDFDVIESILYEMDIGNINSLDEMLEQDK